VAGYLKKNMKITISESEVYLAIWDFLHRHQIQAMTVRLSLDGEPIKKSPDEPLKDRVTFEVETVDNLEY
jgi:hypothetical protein